ncbi:hypothetical protein CONPUDRAFT_169657 [Coniophora puteana RWD-64-598 SS2]|uniref:F-box domain-containing protein n=1 Tax=Coniophora puteana (strain RWD-64-598) TaxID=741705 RepID=A0A5M3M9B3_CONPW|nr:uncharacterized protein CONPUDRAFT_169657 [Coniophora puteana RWD-64-598 SS2]EIW75285.1 hypothetical protein CONPUDRAFT_169657 [Coniophora puteana RWD-64-598 SS2]
MGQDWAFVNIDRREIIDHVGKLGEFFGDCSTARRIGMLLHQIPPLPKMPRIQPSGAESTNVKNFFDRGLLALPNEILYHIANDIGRPEDLVCFAAACHRCWDICSSLLEACIRRDVSWAGCRVICLGDYVARNDLPAGILTEVEQAELDAAGQDECHEGQPVSFYDFAQAHYRERSSGGTAEQFLKILSWRRLVGDAPLAAIEIMFASVKSTVLRNLSKKLYVRVDAINALNEELPQREWFWCDKSYTLGDALVSRICWSTDPSCSMSAHCDDITRGPWAGDAFDITSMEDFQKEENFYQWADAAEEVCEALRQCWDDE